MPVHLDEVLRAVEESARLKGTEKGAAIHLTTPKDAFYIGDPLYLQQAFQNIADNAVEHVGPGGWLNIAIAGTEEGWRATFADNGCGILPEDLPKIFDRYYSNRRGRRSSSGLGLTIAREIVERHGGTITVHSCLEQGTMFTITLPYSETAADPGEAEKI